MTSPELLGPLPADIASLTREQLTEEIDREKAKTDGLYWSFTRTARGRPAGEEQFVRGRWLREARRRVVRSEAA